jgi:hypothetical protein
MEDATDIGCFWFPRQEPSGAAADGQGAPALNPPGDDTLFEAGLAPKRGP